MVKIDPEEALMEEALAKYPGSLEKAIAYYREQAAIKNFEADTIEFFIDLMSSAFQSRAEEAAAPKKEKTSDQKKGKGKSEKSDDETLAYYDVARVVLDQHYIISFMDTGSFAVYDPELGIYVEEGAEIKLKKAVRRTFTELYQELYNPAKRPEPFMSYVKECLELLRIDTAVHRADIEAQEQEHRYLICLKNGVFNVMTGELEPHSPDRIMLKQIPVTYDPQADCPMFRKFLSEVTLPGELNALIEFLGYCLIPDTGFEQAIMLHGKGSNGKSLLLMAIRKFFGPKNTSSVSLQDMQKDRDRFALADLYNKLINTFPDLSAKMLEDDSLFKAATNGDVISAQRKFEHPFDFRNRARMIFSANDLPPHHASFAYFRRWMIMHFTQEFMKNPTPKDLELGKKAADPQLELKITTPEELSGMLNLFLYGLYQLLGNGGYSYPLNVADVERHYIVVSDSIKAFADECLAFEDNVTMDKSTIYTNYCVWCELNGVTAQTRQKLSTRLTKMGFEHDRETSDGQRTRVWVDLVFKPPWQDVALLDSLPELPKKDNQDTSVTRTYLGEFLQQTPDNLLAQNGTYFRFKISEFFTGKVELKKEFSLQKENGQNMQENHVLSATLEKKINSEDNLFLIIKRIEENEGPNHKSTYNVKSSNNSLDKVVPNRPNEETEVEKPVETLSENGSNIVPQHTTDTASENLKVVPKSLADELSYFAENVYKYQIPDVKAFVSDFLVDYPEFREKGFEPIVAVAETLRHGKWKHAAINLRSTNPKVQPTPKTKAEDDSVKKYEKSQNQELEPLRGDKSEQKTPSLGSAADAKKFFKKEGQ